jgi:hypothetical protein
MTWYSYGRMWNFFLNFLPHRFWDLACEGRRQCYFIILYPAWEGQQPSSPICITILNYMKRSFLRSIMWDMQGICGKNLRGRRPSQKLNTGKPIWNMAQWSRSYIVCSKLDPNHCNLYSLHSLSTSWDCKQPCCQKHCKLCSCTALWR